MKLSRIFLYGLASYGGIWLVLTLLFPVLLIASVSPPREPSMEKVLGWVGCGFGRNEVLNVKSYMSGRSPQGDHFDAFEVEFQEMSLSQVAHSTDCTFWTADEVPWAAAAAVEWLDSAYGEAPWLPLLSGLMGQEGTYVHLRSARILRNEAFDAAEVLIVLPNQNRLYLVSQSI